jgi:hypothetical protein
LTVFDEEAQIGNGDRMDDEEQIAKSEWMTERGSKTSPNRWQTKSRHKPYKTI